MSDIMEIWDKGASVYDEQLRHVLPYHRSHEAIVDFLPKTGTIRILDIGAGTGLLSERILHSIPGSSVTCLDFSAKMIDECRSRLRSFGARVSFVCEDLTKWRPREDYDAMVTCNTLIYKGIDVRECYSRLGGALKPGGLFLNSTIVKLGNLTLLSNIMHRLKPAGDSSAEVRNFVEGPGKPLSHLGNDSLLMVLPLQEHLGHMTHAGLEAVCVWQYLYQVIIMGVKGTQKMPNKAPEATR